MISVSLEGKEFIELCDLLKITNLCESGGAAKHIIASGVVKVNGEVELRKRCKIREGSQVEYKGKVILINP